MRFRLGTRVPFAISALALLASTPATGSSHFIKIVEVYGGDASHPDAQFVVLQMCAAGQNLVLNSTINFYDEAGAEIAPEATFAANVNVSTNQAKMLIATSSAQVLFGIAADLQMSANLRVAGGKVCFYGFAGTTLVDCFGWGSYAALPDATIGTPFDIGAGLPAGDSAIRDLSAGTPNHLDCADDTNQSAGDFDPGIPAPRNNAGSSGISNPDHIFIHGFDAGTPGGWDSVSP